MQSVQVYASVSFEAVSPWWPAFHSWDSACVPCAHDVVTEMAIALHATGVKCDVHHVAEKDAQRFVKVGPSVAQNRQRQPGELQPSQPAAALLAAARSVSDIAL